MFRSLLILLKYHGKCPEIPSNYILWMLSNYTRIFNHFTLYVRWVCVSCGSCLSYLPLFMEQNEFDRKLKMTTNRRIINSHHCKQQYRTSFRTDLCFCGHFCFVFVFLTESHRTMWNMNRKTTATTTTGKNTNNMLMCKKAFLASLTI